MGTHKEVETVALSRKMDIFSIVYVASPQEAKDMAEAGADVIIAHVGCTVGGSIGVTDAAMSLDDAAVKTQAIIDAGGDLKLLGQKPGKDFWRIGDVVFAAAGQQRGHNEDGAKGNSEDEFGIGFHDLYRLLH